MIFIRYLNCSMTSKEYEIHLMEHLHDGEGKPLGPENCNKGASFWNIETDIRPIYDHFSLPSYFSSEYDVKVHRRFKKDQIDGDPMQVQIFTIRRNQTRFSMVRKSKQGLVEKKFSKGTVYKQSFLLYEKEISKDSNLEEDREDTEIKVQFSLFQDSSQTHPRKYIKIVIQETPRLHQLLSLVSLRNDNELELGRVNPCMKVEEKELQYFYIDCEETIISNKHMMVAFQGGGVKGTHYTGAIKALQSYYDGSVQIRSIIGSSAGGIIGFTVCCGMTPEEIIKDIGVQCLSRMTEDLTYPNGDQAVEVFCQEEFKKIVHPNQEDLLKWHKYRNLFYTYLNQISGIEKKYQNEPEFSEKTFKNLQKDLLRFKKYEKAGKQLEAIASKWVQELSQFIKEDFTLDFIKKFDEKIDKFSGTNEFMSEMKKLKFYFQNDEPSNLRNLCLQELEMFKEQNLKNPSPQNINIFKQKIEQKKYKYLQQNIFEYLNIYRSIFQRAIDYIGEKIDNLSQIIEGVQPERLDEIREGFEIEGKTVNDQLEKLRKYLSDFLFENDVIEELVERVKGFQFQKNILNFIGAMTNHSVQNLFRTKVIVGGKPKYLNKLNLKGLLNAGLMNGDQVEEIGIRGLEKLSEEQLVSKKRHICIGSELSEQSFGQVYERVRRRIRNRQEISRQTLNHILDRNIQNQERIIEEFRSLLKRKKIKYQRHQNEMELVTLIKASERIWKLELTLLEMYQITGIQFTCTAVDLTTKMLRLFNHKTAPDLPACKAIQITGAFPFAFQPQVWKKQWGKYYTYYEFSRRQTDLEGNIFTDGGMLANFPVKYLDNEEIRRVFFSHKKTSLTQILGFGIRNLKGEAQDKIGEQSLAEIALEEKKKDAFTKTKEDLFSSLKTLRVGRKIIWAKEPEDKITKNSIDSIFIFQFSLLLLKTYSDNRDNFTKESFFHQTYETEITPTYKDYLEGREEYSLVQKCKEVKNVLDCLYQLKSMATSNVLSIKQNLEEWTQFLGNVALTENQLLQCQSLCWNLITTLSNHIPQFTRTLNEMRKSSNFRCSQIKKDFQQIRKRIKSFFQEQDNEQVNLSLEQISRKTKSFLQNLIQKFQSFYSVEKDLDEAQILIPQYLQIKKVEDIKGIKVNKQDERQYHKTDFSIRIKKLFQDSQRILSKIKENNGTRINLKQGGQDSVIQMLARLDHDYKELREEERNFDKVEIFHRKAEKSEGIYFYFIENLRKIIKFPILKREDIFQLITASKDLILQPLGNIKKLHSVIRNCKIPEVFIAMEVYDSRYNLQSYLKKRISKETKRIAKEAQRMREGEVEGMREGEVEGMREGEVERMREGENTSTGFHLIFESMPLSHIYFHEHFLHIRRILAEVCMSREGFSENIGVSSLSASNYHSLTIFLYACSFEEQKIHKQILKIRTLLNVEFKRRIQILELWHDKDKWGQETSEMIKRREGEKIKNVKETIRSTVQMLLKKQPELKGKNKEEIVDILNEKFQGFISKVVKKVFSKTKEETKKYLENIIEQCLQEEAFEINPQSKKQIFQLIINKYRNLIKCAIYTSTYVSEEIMNLTKTDRDLAWKALIVGNFLSCLKIKNFVCEKLSEMNFNEEISLKEFYEKSERKIRLNFTGISQKNQHITIINYLTRPLMPVWAAIVGTSSLPQLFEPMDDLLEWNEKIFTSRQEMMNEAFFEKKCPNYLDQIQLYKKINQSSNSSYSFERNSEMISADLITRQPLDLLTNNKIKKEMDLLARKFNASYDRKYSREIICAFNLGKVDFPKLNRPDSIWITKFNLKELQENFYNLKEKSSEFFSPLYKMIGYEKKVTNKLKALKSLKNLPLVHGFFKRINAYMKSHDEKMKEIYKRESIELPTRFQTLDFHLMCTNDGNNNQILSKICMDSIHQAQKITKQKLTNRQNFEIFYIRVEPLNFGFDKCGKIKKDEIIFEFDQYGDLIEKKTRTGLTIRFLSFFNGIKEMSQKSKIFYTTDESIWNSVDLYKVNSGQSKMKHLSREYVIVEKESNVFPKYLFLLVSYLSHNHISSVKYKLDFSKFIRNEELMDTEFGYVYGIRIDQREEQIIHPEEGYEGQRRQIKATKVIINQQLQERIERQMEQNPGNEHETMPTSSSISLDGNLRIRIRGFLHPACCHCQNRLSKIENPEQGHLICSICGQGNSEAFWRDVQCNYQICSFCQSKILLRS